MKIRAAVLYEVNAPLKVEEIELAEPKAGEVRVKILVGGFCHTDLHIMRGEFPTPLPAVLGHEGAGVVDAVGEGVTTVKPGDHVLMGVIVSCGRCVKCATGQPYWCENAAQPMMTGTLLDGTSRLSKDGRTINHVFCQSSFAEYVVVPETGVAKVREDVPLEKIVGLGCGFGTGLGSVISNPRIRVEAGASVAVIGCGSVGLSAIMGAKLIGASKIVAIDVLQNKLAVAREVGATHTIDALKENPVERTLLDAGQVDFVFECVGKPESISQAFDMIKSSGSVVIVGAVPMGNKVSLDGFGFLLGKNVVGVPAGFMRPIVDMPRYVELYMDGKIPLGKLITGTFKLQEIHKAVEALEKGQAIKSVVLP